MAKCCKGRIPIEFINSDVSFSILFHLLEIGTQKSIWQHDFCLNSLKFSKDFVENNSIKSYQIVRGIFLLITNMSVNFQLLFINILQTQISIVKSTSAWFLLLLLYCIINEYLFHCKFRWVSGSSYILQIFIIPHHQH